MRKVIKRFLLLFAVIIIAVSLVFGMWIKLSPSMQLLVSVLSFSEHTLENPGYLAYNIDLMDLFTNYMNADISFEGNAYIKKMDKFMYSTTGDVAGYRSFTQKKLSMSTDLNVLWANLGGIDAYAHKDTVYVIVPMLDNTSFGFDTDINLFKKGPQLTSDISNEWFRDNYAHIVGFMQKIKIEKTGNVYENPESQEKSYEYKVTTPAGEGKFIFDLLGLDMPDHDIVVSIYLNKWYQTRKIEFDLSRAIDGASLTICDKNMGTCIFKVDLPDNEKMISTLVRNSEIQYANSFNSNTIYYTNSGRVLTTDCIIETKYTDNGMKGKVTELVSKKDGKVVAEGYLEGQITKLAPIEEDLFSTIKVPADEIELMDWKALRDDTESFVNDLIGKAKENLI